jgi:hypothetical protein
MDKHVSFTGTRDITPADYPAIRDMVYGLPATTIIVTGACIGVDAFVARAAKAMSYRVHTVVPADRSRVDPEWRDHCDTFEEMPTGTTYRDRNVRLVELADDEVRAIVAHAEGDITSRRSGTWQTIRLARKAGKYVLTRLLCQECDRAAVKAIIGVDA